MSSTRRSHIRSGTPQAVVSRSSNVRRARSCRCAGPSPDWRSRSRVCAWAEPSRPPANCSGSPVSSSSTSRSVSWSLLSVAEAADPTRGLSWDGPRAESTASGTGDVVGRVPVASWASGLLRRRCWRGPRCRSGPASFEELLPASSVVDRCTSRNSRRNGSGRRTPDRRPAEFSVGLTTFAGLANRPTLGAAEALTPVSTRPG